MNRLDGSGTWASGSGIGFAEKVIKTTKMENKTHSGIQKDHMNDHMQEDQQRQHMAQYDLPEDYSESAARHQDNRSEY